MLFNKRTNISFNNHCMYLEKASIEMQPKHHVTVFYVGWAPPLHAYALRLVAVTPPRHKALVLDHRWLQQRFPPSSTRAEHMRGYTKLMGRVSQKSNALIDLGAHRFGKYIHRDHRDAHPTLGRKIPHLKSWMAVESDSLAFSPSTSLSRSVALANRVRNA